VRRELHAQLEEDERTAVQLSIIEPSADDLVTAARLLQRYPSADPTQFGSEVRVTILNRLAGWGMDEADLFARTRKIWSEGYRPLRSEVEVGYGSGADLSGGD
jgi:hypothetical protein